MMEALAKRKAGDLSQETFIRERTEQTAAIRKVRFSLTLPG
jgi:hypothetical protein